MEITTRPTIIIPPYDINSSNSSYKPLIKLTKEDEYYLNVWREKARKLYKKYNGYFTEGDEKYLVDPDPFECKWYIFRVKPKSRKATPAASPSFSMKSYTIGEDMHQDLIGKFILTP
jgi:hypothetical protein